MSQKIAGVLQQLRLNFEELFGIKAIEINLWATKTAQSRQQKPLNTSFGAKLLEYVGDNLMKMSFWIVIIIPWLKNYGMLCVCVNQKKTTKSIVN